MDITEKWLSDIAGYPTVKAARSIVERGIVAEARREGDTIRGLVSEGPKRYTSGLVIRARMDVENLCTCPTARGRGLICAHSIAVVIATMKPAEKPMERFVRPSVSAPAPAPVQPGIELAPPGSFTFFLPENVLSSSFTGQASVFMKFQPGKGEASDGRIAQWLRTQGVKPGTMPLMLTRKDLSGWLEAARGHALVYLGKPSAAAPTEDQRVLIAEEPLRLPMCASEDGDGDVLLRLDSPTLRRVHDSWCVSPETRTLFSVPTMDTASRQALADIFDAPTALRTVLWLIENRASLDEAFQLRLEGKSLEGLHLVSLPCEFELHIDGSMQAVEAKLFATFGGRRWIVMDGNLNEVNGVRFPMQAAESTTRFYSRNMDRERAAADRLFDLGFQAASATTLRLQGQERVGRFFASELPRLQRLFIVDTSQRWQQVTRGYQRITPKVREPKDDEHRTSNDWLSLDIAYEAPDGFRITRSEVMQLIRSGRRGVKGPTGKDYLLDEESIEEFEESLRDLDGEMTAHGVRVRSDKSQFLFTHDDATFAQRQSATWHSAEIIGAQVPDLAVLLRPYQMDGLRWLDACARGSGAGLLADDMGLGKTLQTIALVRLLCGTTSGTGVPPVTGPAGVPPAAKKRGKAKPAAEAVQARPTTLIICPKSLIANWEREFERFAPGLKVLSIHGADREDDFTLIPEHDAIITTYQLVVRDLKHHQKHRYAALVLDEASYIRNPDTAAAKALRAVRADRRFALTGTPVENSVRDLWSIFQFLLPGYLGSRENFRDRFEKPLATGSTTPAARKAGDRLRKLIRPHFLRRTKQEVLKDLPEKIEQILWCDLSKPQMEVYRRLMEEGLAEVKAARKRTGQGGAKMTMFTVLLRLRQACCHLKMTGLAPESLAKLSSEEQSGKLAMWSERIEQIIAAGGKVLVFSQFVKFLHVLRDELVTAKVDHCYLDGQSNDRPAQVQRFQTDPSAKVFLISLKAGGYGLNLTAADHVMLMDPWWNPAVEAQAIDRAHRMGQERVVTALRLVTRGTVEEKIMKLQAQKRGLIEAALDDEQPMMSGLTEEDLEQVLSE